MPISIHIDFVFRWSYETSGLAVSRTQPHISEIQRKFHIKLKQKMCVYSNSYIVHGLDRPADDVVDPIDVVGNLSEYTGIGCNGAWFHTPGDNSDLFTVNQEWAARVAAALTLAAFRNSSTDVGRMNSAIVVSIAVGVWDNIVIDFLQIGWNWTVRLLTMRWGRH